METPLSSTIMMTSIIQIHILNHHLICFFYQIDNILVKTGWPFQTYPPSTLQITKIYVQLLPISYQFANSSIVAFLQHQARFFGGGRNFAKRWLVFQIGEYLVSFEFSSHQISPNKLFQRKRAGSILSCSR